MDAGFRSVHALPMRLRDVTIGALNLFRTDEGALSDADVAAAQALADVATIAVLHHHSARDTHLVSEQLHHALNIRVVIEQAKGMVAERAGRSMLNSGQASCTGASVIMGWAPGPSASGTFVRYSNHSGQRRPRAERSLSAVAGRFSYRSTS